MPLSFVQSMKQWNETKHNKKGSSTMAKRLYTCDDIMNLPDFIRVELLDGVIYTDDFTDLEIDEEVFQNPPSEDHHVTYRLSIVKD